MNDDLETPGKILYARIVSCSMGVCIPKEQKKRAREANEKGK